MLALAAAAQAQNPIPIVIVIAAVVMAFFWRTILKIGIAALILGFMFVLVNGLLQIVHVLQSLFP